VVLAGLSPESCRIGGSSGNQRKQISVWKKALEREFFCQSPTPPVRRFNTAPEAVAGRQIFSILTAQALYSAVLVMGSMAVLVSQLALLSRK